MKHMKLSKFIGYILTICVFLSGCSNEDYLDDIVFHAEISDVEAYSATITITHNATNQDTYYCYVVEGLVSDIQSEIRRHLSETSSSQLAKEEHSQRKSIFTITRLYPGRTYTLVVFGMKENNKLYGQPDTVVFTTEQSDLEASVNPNWNVQYKGHTVYNDNDFSLIAVFVQGDVAERYFLTTLTASEEARFHSTEELIIQSVFDFIEERDTGPDSDYWLEDPEVRTTGTYFYRYLSPGDYVFYAIGVNPDGLPTGHYAKTSVCTIDKYPAIDSYTNLLGNWEITGNNKTFDVTISEVSVNRYVSMVGWYNSPYPIMIGFNRNDASLSIENQLVASDEEINFTNGTSLTGQLLVVGAYYNAEGTLRHTEPTKNFKLTKATLEADGSYTFKTAFYVSMEDGSKNYKTGMTYYIVQTNPFDYALFATLMFPFSMRKK